MSGTQVHAVHQTRIDRRTGNAGDGDKKNGVQISFAKAGTSQRAAYCLFREIFGDLDPCIVRFSPSSQVVIRFDGQCQVIVPRLHPRQQPLEDFGFPQSIVPVPFKGSAICSWR